MSLEKFREIFHDTLIEFDMIIRLVSLRYDCYAVAKVKKCIEK